MKRPAGRGVGRRLPAIPVVAVVLGCCAIPPARAVAAEPGAPAPRVLVAVEPFANISRNPADAWLGVGMAETVAADLGAAGLSVLESRGAGAASGVRWVVSGGYQRLGERLRITARLVEADSGAVVRSVRLDGALDEIFALQDRIVVELTAGIDLRAATPRPSRTRPRDPRAAPAPVEFAEGIILPRPGVPNVGVPVTGESEPAPPKAVERPGAAAAAGGVRPAPVELVGAPAAGFTPAAGILTGRPSVEPLRTSDPPSIDGRLDDAVWRRATRITEFVQQQPLDGEPATEETDLYIAYDTQNLYFGMHVHYSDPVLIRANRSDRDQTFSDDTITLYFDPFLDQQRAYVFSVNGYGVQSDGILDSTTPTGGMGGGGRRSSGGGGRPGGGGGGGGGGRRGGMSASLAAALGGAPAGDTSWDALFESGGTLVEDGWTAEMAIPFKSLRYPSRGRGERHRWGFQVVRTIPSKNETDVWAPISRDVAGFLPQMGLLDGLMDLSTSRNLEILPTLTAIQFGSLDTGTGVFEDGDPDPEGGVNVKYGVTPNLTFDYTYNPDFSQIESDIPQIEVNQRFPLFYPELRPFFLEGQEIFQVPGQVNLVHTRTIVDPRQGAKLTGKVGNTTVGVLVANDEAPGLVEGVRPGLVARQDGAGGRRPGALRPVRRVVPRRHRDGSGVRRRLQPGGRRRRPVPARAHLVGELPGGRLAAPQPGGRRQRGTDLPSRLRPGRAQPELLGRRRQRRSRIPHRHRLRAAHRHPRGAGQRLVPLVARELAGQLGAAGQLQPQLRLRGHPAGRAGPGRGAGVMTNSIIWVAMANRDMERYGGIEFFKTNAFLGGGFAASRRLSAGGFFNWGDQIRYGDDPFLGRGATATLFASVRPMSRLNADLNFITSRLHDPLADEQVFDVRIYRALTTYQFTNRLLLRNILEYNAFSGTVAANLLVTYRVNAGTVFFVGYDDHYQQGDLIDSTIFPTTRFEQTNRAIFTKLSYLFRF